MRKKVNESCRSISTDMKIIDRYAKNGFCIISAYKPEYSEIENNSKHRKLCEMVYSKNLKFIEIVGHWEEENKNPNEKIEVKILFIPFAEILIHDDLLAISVFLMTKFSQDTVVYYDPDSSLLLYSQERVCEIKKFNFSKIVNEYFFNKRMNPGKKFIIDGSVIPKGFFKSLKLKKKGYIF